MARVPLPQAVRPAAARVITMRRRVVCVMKGMPARRACTAPLPFVTARKRPEDRVGGARIDRGRECVLLETSALEELEGVRRDWRRDPMLRAGRPAHPRKILETTMDSKRTAEFVDSTWQSSIVPALTEYIRIPNKSPAYDEDWAKHGHMDRAVKLIEGWCRSREIEGMKLEVVRLPERTPVIFMEIPGTNGDSGATPTRSSCTATSTSSPR
jgi:hypothetical protein